MFSFATVQHSLVVELQTQHMWLLLSGSQIFDFIILMMILKPNIYRSPTDNKKVNNQLRVRSVIDFNSRYVNNKQKKNKITHLIKPHEIHPGGNKYGQVI